MSEIRAEIVSIGDEIASGVRLDTNTQWLSLRLGEIGISVAFHSTVGDEIGDIVEVFRSAAERAELIVVTGGLGPTADDLTRQAIAEMTGVQLIKHESVLDHIKQMFNRRRREMPANNEIQAWFPEGSKIIDNPEGTAPGIDFEGVNQTKSAFRLIALPGVPVEMKQMWHATVEPALRASSGKNQIIHHYTIHCFGSGESHIETLLPNVIRRGRDPQVGITASAATISLRISTRGDSVEHCLAKMKPTVTIIEECLGKLIYGQNGQELSNVVVEMLAERGKTVAVLDAGLDGAVAQMISKLDLGKQVMVRSDTRDTPKFEGLCEAAAEIAKESNSDFGLAIGSIDRDPQAIETGNSLYLVGIADCDQKLQKQFRFSGHSEWREVRAAKEVLNFFRLHMATSAS